MGDSDKMCHQQLMKASLVCAPSWTSGIGAGDDSDDDDDGTDDNNPSTTSQDSSEATTSNTDHRISSPPNSTAATTSIPQDLELLNISVPTVYLTRTDPSSSSYHIYQIDIESSRGVSWSIYRRYSQFHKLHQQLKGQDPAIDRLAFPPKRRINSKTSTIVQDRRLKLENYLRSLCLYIEKSRPDVDRDTDIFYQFLSSSTKVSENLDDLTASNSTSQPSS